MTFGLPGTVYYELWLRNLITPEGSINHVGLLSGFKSTKCRAVPWLSCSKLLRILELITSHWGQSQGRFPWSHEVSKQEWRLDLWTGVSVPLGPGGASQALGLGVGSVWSQVRHWLSCGWIEPSFLHLESRPRGELSPPSSPVPTAGPAPWTCWPLSSSEPTCVLALKCNTREALLTMNWLGKTLFCGKQMCVFARDPWRSLWMYVVTVSRKYFWSLVSFLAVVSSGPWKACHSNRVAPQRIQDLGKALPSWEDMRTHATLFF